MLAGKGALCLTASCPRQPSLLTEQWRVNPALARTLFSLNTSLNSLLRPHFLHLETVGCTPNSLSGFILVLVLKQSVSM